ncbi:hypothetical protein [Janthinobacterium sp.]|uniref:hypothetical protein n=1 Tax=Janthinobacterium sp. TaxID=1871054 RepID=UPI0028A0E508|nr:hypothetical protein [Janthinobacterium sp.]
MALDNVEFLDDCITQKLLKINLSQVRFWPKSAALLSMAGCRREKPTTTATAETDPKQTAGCISSCSICAIMECHSPCHQDVHPTLPRIFKLAKDYQGSGPSGPLKLPVGLPVSRVASTSACAPTSTVSVPIKSLIAVAVKLGLAARTLIAPGQGGGCQVGVGHGLRQEEEAQTIT